MKEYKVFKIGETGEITERFLNSLAKEGWKLVGSYARNNEWLIMGRTKQTEEIVAAIERRDITKE